MDRQIITDLVVTWAVPAVLGVLTGWCVSTAHKTKAEVVALRDGVRTMLRSRLVDLHERFVVSGGPCPDWVKREAEQVYSAYHALGGNGIGTHYYEEIINAPVGVERG